MNNPKRGIADNYAIKNVKKPFTATGNCLRALLMLCLATLSCQLSANQQEITPATISYGDLSEKINDDIRLNIIKQNDASLVSDLLTGKATGKTRDEILQTQQAMELNELTASSRALTLSINDSYSPEFTIYNASTMLFDDFDEDGYYQTLSVIFDPDVYSYDGNDIQTVYARLYLSENGGPWFH
ncbi:MAG: hypothetical protein OQK77_01060, partial [Psychromonas sp.]|nr:hypothetical protein [Psychromonas sp.]